MQVGRSANPYIRRQAQPLRSSRNPSSGATLVFPEHLFSIFPFHVFAIWQVRVQALHLGLEPMFEESPNMCWEPLEHVFEESSNTCSEEPGTRVRAAKGCAGRQILFWRRQTVVARNHILTCMSWKRTGSPRDRGSAPPPSTCSRKVENRCSGNTKVAPDDGA